MPNTVTAMPLLTPAHQAALAAKARRRWRVDAAVLGVVALVLRLPALFATRTLVFDDGVFAASAVAMRAGELPFRDVFSSQGALFLPLVWLGDLVGFRTLDAPRVLAVAAGIVLTVASYSCARQLTTRSHALLAAGLVTTSGSVLWVTGPINADGPTLALSVLAVAFALRYRHHPRLADAVYVGLTAGAAMSVKAIAGPAVLVAGLVVLVSHRRVLDAVAAAAVGAAVLFVTALPWGIDRVWDQAFRYHTDAARQDSVLGALGKVLHTLWQRDLAVLVALALAGVFLLLARRRDGARGHPRDRTSDHAAARPNRSALMLIGWAALVLVLLVVEPALWRAHVAHLVVPLALLAAVAPPPWRVLVVAALVMAPIWVLQQHTLLWPNAYAGEQAAMVARLRSLPVDAAVISDDPGLVWRAGRRVPGEFADASFLRLDRGDITVSSLVRAARATDVCGVLVTSPEHYGRFPALGDRLEAHGYLPERFGEHITLYARPGCDPS